MILRYFNNMIFIRNAVFLFAFLASANVYAQPELEITPDDMKFEDTFSRLENVYFINEGTQLLWIDSVVYNNNLYYVRFDSPYTFPFYIEPGDTVKMDCIIAGYYYVPSSDTSDTMYVYSNSINGMEDIGIKIDYWDDDFGEGRINGFVTDSISPVPNTNIYFFYEGNYIIHSTNTDQYGYYSAILPPGSYTIAAEKDSHYVTFFGQRFDPFNAEFVLLEDDSVKTANIILPKEEITSNSVSGRVYDSLSGTPLYKGIVVVRNGNHTPTKISSGSNRITSGSYTAFINGAGLYQIDNIIEPGYYYIQSFSDYFVPSYYSSSGVSQIFWQNADSVYIDSGINNLHIFMPRDSSLGGGNALGSVSINTRSGDSILDVIIYAQPVNNDTSVFNYAFTSQSGNFNIPFLPYGDYKLVAQKIGYNDGYSSAFTIDSVNTTIGNLEITLFPVSIDENPFVPENHILLFNYPNPFNPETTIGFILPFSSEVELKVFNVLGEEVRTLLKEHLSPGKYEIGFNAEELTSGTYFVILKTKEGIVAKKILLLK
ncbi:MAG: T9SS type A sorting domain-containing protein [Ignavibacteria bacterium]|nr:T9SS type A sorting domain-containing protein [Ignavibacteria bacterium]